MNDTIEPKTTDAAAELAEEIKKRFDDQEADFAKQEKVIADMRAWVVRNREKLSSFRFCISGLDVNFYSFYRRREESVKDIARAFGSAGWKREKDSYTCGAIHWVKEFEGAKLKIHEAEIVKLNPIEDVKL